VTATPPVLFIIFNRPDTTARVFEAIRQARPPRLYVAADGPRSGSENDAERCAATREIATAVDWACEVKTLFHPENLGVRFAPSMAIDWFFENEAEGVILEDDCLPSADFFPFCAELLERFRADERIMAICGSDYASHKEPDAPSYYFSYYADMWGWATWRRAWRHYDKDLSRWPDFKARGGLDKLAEGRPWRGKYWADLFDATRRSDIATWDYQWIYTVIECRGLACYPAQNLISNIGHRADATHTVRDPGAAANHLANLPHEILEFPLVHPRVVERSEVLEAQIEAKRLGLAPPDPSGVPALAGALHTLKQAARRLLGDAMAGTIDYYRFPERGTTWGLPFNGQKGRQQLFLAIVKKIAPAAIVETGARLGTTTEFMARAQIPIYAIEECPRNFGFARARLRRRRGVHVLRGESGPVLEALLLKGSLHSLKQETLFLYLDPQRNNAFRLAENLDIIFSNCPAAVVMIDDFQVPFDIGYGYDDDGAGKTLKADSIGAVCAAHELDMFFPSMPSSQESGECRGCIVLAKRQIHAETLKGVPLLRAGA
jgi:hypothetical protein